MLPTPGTLREHPSTHTASSTAHPVRLCRTLNLSSIAHLCSWGSSVSLVPSSFASLQQYWRRWQQDCPGQRVQWGPVLSCWAGCPHLLLLQAQHLLRLLCCWTGCLLLFAWLAVSVWLLCPEACAEETLSLGAERPAHPLWCSRLHCQGLGWHSSRHCSWSCQTS